jgi:hypothetical protein
MSASNERTLEDWLAEARTVRSELFAMWDDAPLDAALIADVVGAVLGLEEKALRNLRIRRLKGDEGSGPPFIRVGSSVRYIKRDVLAYLQAQRQSVAARPTNGAAEPPPAVAA